MTKFYYNKFDLKNEISNQLMVKITKVIENHAEHIELSPTSVTSREIDNTLTIESIVLDGNAIKTYIPELFELYEGTILNLVKSLYSDQPVTANSDLYAINLNIQKGMDMRYECHVDSNPIQGVLYLSEHNEGGELVVSNTQSALGVEQIEEDAVIIKPKTGMLYIFDGRKNPHYVRPLTNKSEIRIAVTMNFYTNKSSEKMRPSDLTKHLFEKI